MKILYPGPAQKLNSKQYLLIVLSTLGLTFIIAIILYLHFTGANAHEPLPKVQATTVFILFLVVLALFWSLAVSRRICTLAQWRVNQYGEKGKRSEIIRVLVQYLFRARIERDFNADRFYKIEYDEFTNEYPPAILIDETMINEAIGRARELLQTSQ